MARDLQALKNELVNDPTTIGYSDYTFPANDVTNLALINDETSGITKSFNIEVEKWK